MAFIDTIFDSLGISTVGAFKATILGDCGGYFENVTEIKKYSESEITLAFKKGTLTVSGCGLYIKKYCMGDVAICGKITQIVRS